MEIAKATGLFAVTAFAEIAGCYLPLLWLQRGYPIWVLVPGAISLALFVYLLTLHPAPSGRVYAAYGGVYVCAALVWLFAVDGVRPTIADVTGGSIALLGMAIIVSGFGR
jgi:small multidrug resistance family-3 protein